MPYPKRLCGQKLPKPDMNGGTWGGWLICLIPKLYTKILLGVFLPLFVFNGSLAGKTSWATLIKVSDGDTIQVRYQNKKVKVRLYGIDAPEKKQAAGKGATRFLQQILGLKFKLKVVKKDRYKRLVAFVISSNGENINYKMVRAGWAWWYKKYYKSQKMASLQQKAKHKGIGLWSGKNPRPPWLFRAWKKKMPNLAERFRARIIYVEPGRFYLNYKGAALIVTTGKVPKKNCKWNSIKKQFLFESVIVTNAHYRRARFIRGKVSYQGLAIGSYLKLEKLCD